MEANFLSKLDMTDETRRNFYVYGYLRARDGTPYYIGKGTGRRALVSNGRVKVPKDKSRVIFFSENLTEQEAFSLEIKLIAKWGRVVNGSGVLLNITEGGEGFSGLKPWNLGTKGMYSSDPKGKLKGTSLFKDLVTGEIFRAKPCEVKDRKDRIVGVRFGIPVSAEHKEKISAHLKGRKKSEAHRENCSKAFKGLLWIHNFETGLTKRIKPGLGVPPGFVIVSGPHKLMTAEQKLDKESRDRENKVRVRLLNAKSYSENNSKAQTKFWNDNPLFRAKTEEVLLWLKVLHSFSASSFEAKVNSIGKTVSVQRTFSQSLSQELRVSLHTVLSVLNGKKSRPLRHLYGTDCNFRCAINLIPDIYRKVLLGECPYSQSRT
jgi:hypothetical protein